MAVVTLEQVKAQLNFTDDIGTLDDELLTLKINAAQSQVERLLGYKLIDRFGGEDQDPIPPALQEAICQLAAWWYEQRESVGGSSMPIPLGFNDIIREYREWTF